MDILRKELDAIYASQRLGEETLDARTLTEAIGRIKVFTSVSDCCCVITDASADRCYIIGGRFCRTMGIAGTDRLYEEVDSSDEDVIYSRLHPEDLVEKRMLEYEFFKHIDSLPGADKVRFKATCTVRIRDCRGEYVSVANSTQVLHPSPAGKTWLILCCYDLAPAPQTVNGIEPHIVNNSTGERIAVATSERRPYVLTGREKEILRLIRDGKPSKQIADILGISIHTVNRHRQNIIGKLSVGSTVEALRAAELMKLM